MKTLFALFVLAANAAAQQQFTVTFQPVGVTAPGTTGEVLVSFTPQGAASLKALTGKKIKGVGLASISVCSMTAQTVPGQLVKQWGRFAGISWIDGPGAGVIESRTAANTLTQLAIDLGSDAPAIITGLIASKVISTSGSFGLVMGGISIGTAVVKGRLASRLPDPAKLAAVALPAAISIPAGGCATAPGAEYLQMVRFDQAAKTAPTNLRCSGWSCAAIH